MAYGQETVGPQTVQASFKNPKYLGRFAELGGSLDLYGNWVPAQMVGAKGDDPETAAARIMAVAGYLENTRAPLEAARQIAIRDTREHFDKEEAPPGGTPWAELSDVPPGGGYASYKDQVAPETNILELTGTLGDVAASDQTWIIIGEVLVFDPAALPEYGPIHQRGRGATTFNVGAGFSTIETKGMPARPFIGLSKDAILEIAAVFERWYAGAEIIFDGPIERLGFNKRGALPIIGHTPSGQPRLSSGQFGRK